MNSTDRRLVDACGRGDLPAVEKCIEQGADIHMRNDAIVRWLATIGNLAIVKYLIDQGANIHVFNDEALRRAARNKQLKVVNYLREVAGDEYKCHRCIIRSTCLDICKNLRS